MTIETHLKSIDASLITIALTLSAIAAGTGVEAPKSAGKKPAAKKEPKETGAAAKATKEEPKGPKLEDVRSALTAVQAATDGKTARELLSKVGGNGTLSKVKPAKYQEIIDAAAQAVAEADEASD